MLRWDGGYLLVLLAVGSTLVLTMVLPTGRIMSIVVANDPTLWQGAEHAELREGIVFVSVPQVAVVIGPLALAEYLAHKVGEYRSSELEKLEERQVDPASLPECRRADEMTLPVDSSDV